MFGPHAIGTERFVTVSSGPSFAQVAEAILAKRARVENPDKDEIPGPAPGAPACHRSFDRQQTSARSAGITPMASGRAARPEYRLPPGRLVTVGGNTFADRAAL
jgi:hypothetical protein